MTDWTAPQTRVRRVPKNARYDRDSVYRVLDRGAVAHIAFTSDDGQPYCIPTLYARVEDRVLIHGSSASRMVGRLAAGARACLTVTILDGWVLARSAFEHSVNYDSAILFGRFRAITDPRDKLAALEAFMQVLVPDRWSEVRPPSRQELKGTAILELEIDQATVKTRGAPPDDDDLPDAALDTWAGVIPITRAYGAPQPSPGLRPGVALSPSIERLLAARERPDASGVERDDLTPPRRS